MNRIFRLTLAIGLALCLGLVFTPLGCGGNRGFEASSHGGDGPSVPDAIVSELRACAEKGKDRLKESTYALHFAVEVTEDGHVDRVKRKESLPPDHAMESCMADALEGMRVPLAVVQSVTPQGEQAEAVSPQSRGLMGNPLLFAIVAVELAPVLVVAAGVTIIVGVSIYAAEEIIEAAKRRNRTKEKCLRLFNVCLGNRKQPEWNRDMFGEWKECQFCLGRCIKDNGTWPEDKCPMTN